MRTHERTRLAVELHDALSQNLTGVTFQLDASKKARMTSPALSEKLLDTAMQTLASCRTELGRCLWDLRSEALDEPDFTEAIKKVIQPLTRHVFVQMRFNIPREKVGDATAHAVLRIIRELVANAVKHGNASKIRIAGDISTGTLKFAVTDNGQGFEVISSPGPAEGHFGIEGIRERIRTFNGKFNIRSRPGYGTRIIIEIPAPAQEPMPT